MSAMTPGQALDWMIAHPGGELEDSDGDRWRWSDEWRTEINLRGAGWREADIASGPTLTWHVPRRKLPALPEGARYVLDDGPPYVKCDDLYCVGFANSAMRAAIYRALAEEFETRPKTEAT